MIILPALAALTLYSEPPQAPSRLDPDDIEALSALLEALAAGETPPVDDVDAAATETDETDDAATANGASGDDEAEQSEADSPATPGTDEMPEDEAAEDEASDDAAPEDGIADDEASDPGIETAETDDTVSEPADDTTPTEQPASEPDTDPAAQPDSPEAEEAAQLPAPPARAIETMGPHVGAGAYEAVRGRALGQGFAFVWSVSIGPLGDAGAGLDSGGSGNNSTARRFLAGEGWAAEENDDTLRLADFAAGRKLRIDHGGETVTNTSLYAGARRNVDIYFFLSEGAQRDRIEFGPGTVFDRFWLESAMSVAAEPVTLTAEEVTRDDGAIELSWRRKDSERIIASARYGSCEAETADITDEARLNLLAGLGHTLAWHPQLTQALLARDELPCVFSFAVISPDSPQGRVEHWSLQSAESASIDLAPSAEFTLLLPDMALLDADAITAAVSAATGERGEAPVAPEFLGEVQALRSEGDYAGALLMLAQETAHFGPCPAETIGSERLACADAASLARAGAGNADFERVMEATSAVQEGAHRVAIESIGPFAARNGLAGAAARTILANEILAMGAEGLEAYPQIDPAELLAEALAIDPFAPDAYWHLGRRYLEAGAPEAAWVLFDLGRALPGRSPTPLLGQVNRMEESLRQLAPALFGPVSD